MFYSDSSKQEIEPRQYPGVFPGQVGGQLPGGGVGGQECPPGFYRAPNGQCCPGQPQAPANNMAGWGHLMPPWGK